MRRKEDGGQESMLKGKHFQFSLVQANVITRFYTSTVSRREQPAGRSIQLRTSKLLRISLFY